MKKVIKYSTNTPLSIDISPHGGESAGCMAGCADETQKVASTLAPLFKGSSRQLSLQNPVLSLTEWKVQDV